MHIYFCDAECLHQNINTAHKTHFLNWKFRIIIRDNFLPYNSSFKY